jgi:hypothetical protein
MAIIAAVGGVMTAIIGVVIGQLTRLNGRLQRLERRDRLSWLYIQKLIAHVYQHNAGPLPEPPLGWLEGGQ